MAPSAKKDDAQRNEISDEYACSLCVKNYEEKAGFEEHLRTERHRFNYYLWRFEKRRKRLVKDRHGIVIKVQCFTQDITAKDGSAICQVDPSTKEVVYQFKISNVSNDKIFANAVCLLHPHPVFEISDEEGLSRGKAMLRMFPGCSYNVVVRFINMGIGTYGVPVCFTFTPCHNEKDFNIVRVMVVKVIEAEHLSKSTYTSPYIGEEWNNMHEIVYGYMSNGRPIRKLLAFRIPYDHALMFRHWLGPWPNMTESQCQLLWQMSTIFVEGYKNLKQNYITFFRNLLYFEEYDGGENIQLYNMTDVEMKLVLGEIPRFELEVPGLAEKRPSLIKGDLVYVRVKRHDGSFETKSYEGIIFRVLESVVWICGFSHELTESFHNRLRFDVQFVYNRYPIFIMQKGLKLLTRYILDEVIFPRQRSALPLFLKNKVNKMKYRNSKIADNPEQKQAVINIVRGTSRPAPYIVYGPPGTGKTSTIVEAIVQVKTMFPNSYCLVTAPSNSACDNLAQRLAKYCTAKELIRLHSSSRDWSSVPQDIYQFSNRSANEYYFPTTDVLRKYRIIVCTLILSSRLKSRSFLDDDDDNYDESDDFINSSHEPHSHFTHLFIDECGQALEPESLVAIGLLGKVSPGQIGGQLILAGDPKQLGPVCSKTTERVYKSQQKGSEETLDERIGLGVSLLERLMETCSIYKKTVDGSYDQRYVTMLKYNYRSHPTILQLSNALYYDNKLEYKCSKKVRFDPLISIENFGSPLIFHNVIGHEKREGRSPSHFNEFEVNVVIKYVKELMNSSVNVDQSEVGIISPYIRQVYKIKAALRSMKIENIEVGTTETFQGREKRVIIISTVRSNRNLLDYDKKYNLGFLVSEKRFNVAMTRAQSLLIVVGNSQLLALERIWLALIEHCETHGSFRGPRFTPRDDRWVSSVLAKLRPLRLNADFVE